VKDLKEPKKHISVLAPEFPDTDIVQVKAYVTCTATPDKDQIHSLLSSNGFAYPPYPTHLLPPFDCISEACDPKTSIYANQKIGISDGRI
jgi:hypothetical protein